MSSGGGSDGNGDLETRFAKLIADHGASLGRVAWSYTRNHADQQDLFQDIAIAIWRALPRFRAECSERTFVFRIAHNRGITHLSRRRQVTVEASDELEVSDGRPTPEQALASSQKALQLLDAVQSLPLAYRQVVTLALEGMSYGDIADVLGITESNVGVRLTRARLMLRRLL